LIVIFRYSFIRAVGLRQSHARSCFAPVTRSYCRLAAASIGRCAEYMPTRHRLCPATVEAPCPCLHDAVHSLHNPPSIRATTRAPSLKSPKPRS